jgi:SAM-dependent methyltransferase
MLSRLGERLHSNWLTYNPLHFYSFHEHALRNAPGVVRCLKKAFPTAQTYLDVGAGSGAFAAECARSGLTVMACEHSPAGRRLAKRQGVDIRAFDLAMDPPSDIDGRFDVAYCFEVAEHLPPALGERLIAFLAKKGRTVIFTAAMPGQRGTGHINEQPREYWISRFTREGAQYLAGDTLALSRAFASENLAPWFEANVSVFASP